MVARGAVWDRSLDLVGIQPRRLQAVNGPGTAERLFASGQSQYAGPWSPDGGAISFSQLSEGTSWDVAMLLLSFERGASAMPQYTGFRREVVTRRTRARAHSPAPRGVRA